MSMLTSSCSFNQLRGGGRHLRSTEGELEGDGPAVHRRAQVVDGINSE